MVAAEVVAVEKRMQWLAFVLQAEDAAATSRARAMSVGPQLRPA